MKRILLETWIPDDESPTATARALSQHAVSPVRLRIPTTGVKLTYEECALALEALDSHLYWQMAEDDNRNNGEVIEDTPEMAPFRALMARLLS